MSLTVEKCLQAWTNSLKQMHVKADIVFFGDSHIYYGDFCSVFPDKVVCNLGLRGDTINGMIGRVDQVKILGPKIIYLMAGINDVTTCTIEEFETQYELLIKYLIEQVPNTSIIIQSMLPVNDIHYNISCNNYLIISYNNIIKHLATVNNLHFIDLYSAYSIDGLLSKDSTIDGLHLTKDAYIKWYKLLNK